MRVKLSAKVKTVSEKSEYYPNKRKYIQADIEIQENERNINGNLSVRENLNFGQTVTIYLDTTKTNDVVQEITDEEYEDVKKVLISQLENSNTN